MEALLLKALVLKALVLTLLSVYALRVIGTAVRNAEGNTVHYGAQYQLTSHFSATPLTKGPLATT